MPTDDVDMGTEDEADAPAPADGDSTTSADGAAVMTRAELGLEDIVGFSDFAVEIAPNRASVIAAVQSLRTCTGQR